MPQSTFRNYCLLNDDLGNWYTSQGFWFLGVIKVDVGKKTLAIHNRYHFCIRNDDKGEQQNEHSCALRVSVSEDCWETA